jgi:hypothetical protein
MAHTHIPYDISFAAVSVLITLTQRESGQLRTALGKDPSEHFLAHYVRGLTSYIEYHQEIGRVTPKQVGRRLKKVLKHGEALCDAIAMLAMTDRCYIGKFWMRRVLADQDNANENQLLRALELFLADVAGATNELGEAQGKGAMPRYAKQALAREIAQALYLENGRFPPLTRGKIFERVLKCALDAGNKRIDKTSKPVRDVMDLMLSAKSQFGEDGAT